MDLEVITIAFLIALFAAAEIYRIKRGRKGTILSVNDFGLPSVVLPAVELLVRLPDGQEVIATASCCVACMGRLKIGDQVRVCQSKDGYTADLLWSQSRSCSQEVSSCERASA